MSEWTGTLDKAKALWHDARREWRDTKLEVGRLLHRSLVERLREEADHLDLSQRAARGVSRPVLINHMAVALGLSIHNRQRAVNNLMRVAVAADMLCPDGNLGSLTYTHLAHFQTLIQRRPGTAARVMANGDLKAKRRSCRVEVEEPVLPSQKEEHIWVVPEADARALFVQVRDEGWDGDETRSRVLTLMRKDNTRARSRMRAAEKRAEEARPEGGLAVVRDMAMTADPRDLADLLLGLCALSTRKDEVRRILLERVSAGV